MDLFPLVNSLRIALIATIITFSLGTFAAYYVSKIEGGVQGLLDMLFMLPLVLPPTVIGFFILKVTGPSSSLGMMASKFLNTNLVMKWHSGIGASAVVTFPLMYRTARGAFEAFDEDLRYAAQTLGRSNLWIFWNVVMPNSRQGILAGVVLTFARALGEYGATSMVSGYVPGKTATISTTVYHLWSTGQDSQAYKWVILNVSISLVVLMVINVFERTDRYAPGKS